MSVVLQPSPIAGELRWAVVRCREAELTDTAGPLTRWIVENDVDGRAARRPADAAKVAAQLQMVDDQGLTDLGLLVRQYSGPGWPDLTLQLRWLLWLGMIRSDGDFWRFALRNPQPDDEKAWFAETTTALLDAGLPGLEERRRRLARSSVRRLDEAPRFAQVRALGWLERLDELVDLTTSLDGPWSDPEALRVFAAAEQLVMRAPDPDRLRTILLTAEQVFRAAGELSLAAAQAAAVCSSMEREGSVEDWYSDIGDVLDLARSHSVTRKSGANTTDTNLTWTASSLTEEWSISTVDRDQPVDETVDVPEPPHDAHRVVDDEQGPQAVEASDAAPDGVANTQHVEGDELPSAAVPPPGYGGDDANARRCRAWLRAVVWWARSPDMNSILQGRHTSVHELAWTLKRWSLEPARLGKRRATITCAGRPVHPIPQAIRDALEWSSNSLPSWFVNNAEIGAAQLNSLARTIERLAPTTEASEIIQKYLDGDEQTAFADAERATVWLLGHLVDHSVYRRAEIGLLATSERENACAAAERVLEALTRPVRPVAKYLTGEAVILCDTTDDVVEVECNGPYQVEVVLQTRSGEEPLRPVWACPAGMAIGEFTVTSDAEISPTLLRSIGFEAAAVSIERHFRAHTRCVGTGRVFDADWTELQEPVLPDVPEDGPGWGFWERNWLQPESPSLGNWPERGRVFAGRSLTQHPLTARYASLWIATETVLGDAPASIPRLAQAAGGRAGLEAWMSLQCSAQLASGSRLDAATWSEAKARATELSQNADCDWLIMRAEEFIRANSQETAAEVAARACAQVGAALRALYFIRNKFVHEADHGDAAVGRRRERMLEVLLVLLSRLINTDLDDAVLAQKCLTPPKKNGPSLCDVRDQVLGPPIHESTPCPAEELPDPSPE